MERETAAPILTSSLSLEGNDRMKSVLAPKSSLPLTAHRQECAGSPPTSTPPLSLTHTSILFSLSIGLVHLTDDCPIDYFDDNCATFYPDDVIDDPLVSRHVTGWITSKVNGSRRVSESDFFRGLVCICVRISKRMLSLSSPLSSS